VLSGSLIVDVVLAAAVYGLLAGAVVVVLWLTGGERDDGERDGGDQDGGGDWRRGGTRPDPPRPQGPRGVGTSSGTQPVRGPPRRATVGPERRLALSRR
jgi:hypothetical protein